MSLTFREAGSMADQAWEGRAGVPRFSAAQALMLVSVLGLAIVASAVAFVAVDQPLTGVDDANIFLVYARNLASGHGLVYYPGGERVEGFTSLAWVLVCAAAVASSTKPELVLVVVNV